MEAREELLQVLREARALLARPGNDFVWSSWDNAAAALAEMDQVIAAIESDTLPRQNRLSLLFAPTGPIQEVSIDSGWGGTFINLADRFDRALARFYA